MSEWIEDACKTVIWAFDDVIRLGFFDVRCASVRPGWRFMRTPRELCFVCRGLWRLSLLWKNQLLCSIKFASRSELWRRVLRITMVLDRIFIFPIRICSMWDFPEIWTIKPRFDDAQRWRVDFDVFIGYKALEVKSHAYLCSINVLRPGYLIWWEPGVCRSSTFSHCQVL